MERQLHLPKYTGGSRSGRSQGNVVWYVLRYDSKMKEGVDLSRPDNSNLSVTAVWVPAPVAEQIISSAGSPGR